VPFEQHLESSPIAPLDEHLNQFGVGLRSAQNSGQGANATNDRIGLHWHGLSSYTDDERGPFVCSSK
jgi:hypothetical protein